MCGANGFCLKGPKDLPSAADTLHMPALATSSLSLDWRQESFTDEQARAFYILDGFHAINHFLRTGEVAELEKEIFALTEAKIQDVCQALIANAKPLEKETELWRGTKWRECHNSRSFSDPAFASFSRHWEPAYQFASERHGNWEAPVVLNITAPAGTLAIEGLDAEDELILLPGQKLEKAGHATALNNVTCLHYLAIS